MEQLNGVRWLKSSYSGGGGGQGGGNCVEVAAAGAGRAVRDSKNPNGPALVFAGAAWDAFVASVKRGDLNA